MFLLGNETLPTLVIVYIITFPRISTCTSSCVPTISRGRGRDAHGTHVLSVVLLASTCSSGEGRWLSPSLHLLVSVRRLHNMAGNESFKEYVGSAADAAAFNQRLQARDDGRTKRTVGDVDDGESTGTDKAREYVRTLQGTARMESMAKLREQSRQSYLSKREELELKKLELKIRDEETMFATETLTAEERHRLEQDKELLAIAKRRRILRSDAVGYYVPGGGNDIVEGEAVPVRPAREEFEAPVGTVAVSRAQVPSAEAEKAYNMLVSEEQIGFIDSKGHAEQHSPHPATPVLAQPVKKKMAIADVRKALPIYPFRAPLLKAIQKHQVIIVVAETGSGKTTQIPQYLHEVGYTNVGKVACTQPRRVAAMSVASRVADEVGCRLGQEVGYSIRFENCESERTKIKYMTDGMLLREFLTTPDLKDYIAIMIDEAHERTLHTDVLFGLIKDIARFRDDIKIIISSATLDADKFAKYFDNAPIFNVPGRRFPVDVLYCKQPEANYLDAVVVTVLQIHVTQPEGDILVFCTGQQEIEDAAEDLRQRMQGLGTKIRELVVLPIYATLPSEEQAKIFIPPPPGGRKVILGTNIAETSLTIDGIKYVIDTGFCKQKTYNPRTGMESLVVTPVSKAAADQRSGRAGRTSAGKAFRLYTRWAFENELPETTTPEIQRTNLANVVLMLKSLGIHDMLNFDFMDPPQTETLMRSFEKLYALGALNNQGELTKLGRRMAEFPTSPELSKMLIASERYGCTEECLTIAAMLDVSNSVFSRPKGKRLHADNAKKHFGRGGHGDHILLLNCYNEWVEAHRSKAWCFEHFVQIKSMRKAKDIRTQLRSLCDRVEVDVRSDNSPMPIAKAITAGFFFNAAKFQKNGTYRTVKSKQVVDIHPSSSLFAPRGGRREAVAAKQQKPPPEMLVYHELVLTSKEFIRQITPIQEDWLQEIAPHYYQNVGKSKTGMSQTKKVRMVSGGRAIVQ